MCISASRQAQLDGSGVVFRDPELRQIVTSLEISCRLKRIVVRGAVLTSDVKSYRNLTKFDGTGIAVYRYYVPPYVKLES
jgi:hypothetical protein